MHQALRAALPLPPLHTCLLLLKALDLVLEDPVTHTPCTRKPPWPDRQALQPLRQYNQIEYPPSNKHLNTLMGCTRKE
jgi:hypothetical protein